MEIISANLTVTVSPLSIYPELMIKVPIKTANQKELLIFQSGGVFTEDNKCIADVKLSTGNNKEVIYHLFTHKTEYYTQFIENTDQKYAFNHYTFTIILSKEAIDHIENIRNRNSKKGVDLYIELLFQQQITGNDLIKNLGSTGASRVEIIKSIIKSERCSFEISQSRWIQEFTEPLKIGRFLLLELNIPENKNKNNDWIEPIERAIHSLHKVEEFIKEGRWYDAIKSARKISELFKFKTNNGKNEIETKNREGLKKLFEDINISASGFDEFCSLVENLFNFISKFEHEKDKEGKLLPVPRPEKEDAYFVYATSVAIVNMISNKIK